MSILFCNLHFTTMCRHLHMDLIESAMLVLYLCLLHFLPILFKSDGLIQTNYIFLDAAHII